MLLEETPPSSTSLVVHLIIVGFHHKKGHQIEYSYPLLNEPIDERWSNIAALALSNDIQDNKTNDELKSNLMKRATSITNKLSDTFNRLTTTATTAAATNVAQNYSQDLTHLGQFQFPLPLFEKNNILHPYLSIYSLDLVNNSKLNSFVIGASNGLFRQQNTIDFIVTDQDDDSIIQSGQIFHFLFVYLKIIV